MSDSGKKGISPEIIAALIGVAGTIIAGVLFSGNGGGSNEPPATSEPIIITATFMPTDTPMPTDTVPPGEPTSTPAPTETPAPEPTDVPPVAMGQDWTQGCISTLWRTYPSTLTVIDKGDGCLQEPVHVFDANNGVLSFLGERSGSGSVDDYGLFAPLPESGAVTVTVRLDDLTNVDFWIGVFPEPDLKSNGLLLTIPEGNVRKRVVVQKDPFTYETMQSTQNVDQGNGFSFTFTFTSATATGEVNPFVFKTNPMSVPAANKWFYIGYRGFNNSYRIEGSIADFILQ